MKTLGICGDSWFAATQDLDRGDCKDSKGKHFSEILAKKLNYDLYTLARGACSNSAIRLQISEMVKRKVDLIIIGTTSANRIEYPACDKEYDPMRGIYNIHYSSYPDLSSLQFNRQDEVLYSDTLTNLFGNKVNCGPVRSEEQRQAIKNYYLEAFDIKFREQQDSWIIASGIQEIRDANIPYLLIGQVWLYYSNYFKNKVNEVIGTTEISPWNYAKNSIRRWHTDDHSQVVLADKIYNYLLENSIINPL